MVFKAAHLPTTPHTSATPVETVFTALWFYPSFYSFSDSLTWQVYQVCCVFHFLNKKLKWHLSHSFTKTWLSYPISALLLLDYRLHFGRINRLASTRECSPTRPCDSSPISLFTSAPGGSRGSRARLLCPGLSRLSQHPRHSCYSLESETWAEPALAGWQFLLLCDRFLDK